ncbi:DUF6434 domain-containing protein [Sphingomonas sp. RB3P16]|uniref:DUF6434 domain-containing protein n=1 Tax=Parasphingomonas frigoris TaxID=3096163 RepID=UPI002FCAD74C
MKPDFDWHGATIEPSTVVDHSYRNTQNVRRFFIDACGLSFTFDRDFMAYLKDGQAKTMGDAANEWIRARSTRVR